jgi:hypothetical protein
MAEAIYVLSTAFKKVCLFKPITSRHNAEKYLLCFDRKNNVNIARKIFDRYYEQICEFGYCTKIDIKNVKVEDIRNRKKYAKPVLPGVHKDFIQKLETVNNQYIDIQMQIVEMIEKLGNNIPVRIPKYDLHKAIVVWHLPAIGDINST